MLSASVSNSQSALQFWPENIIKKIMIGATLVETLMPNVAPFLLYQSRDGGLSLSVDRALVASFVTLSVTSTTPARCLVRRSSPLF
jgi:hypothetical protein